MKCLRTEFIENFHNAYCFNVHRMDLPKIVYKIFMYCHKLSRFKSVPPIEGKRICRGLQIRSDLSYQQCMLKSKFVVLYCNSLRPKVNSFSKFFYSPSSFFLSLPWMRILECSM